MNKIYLILFFFLWMFSLRGQEWKKYPYRPVGSLISFPKDEGIHPIQPEEWWYTIAHLRGKTSGDLYTIMLTYFSKDTLGLDGFRILNFSNETKNRFFDNTRPCNFIRIDSTALDIEAQLPTHTEYWKTSRDSSGQLIPFEYDIHALTTRGTIDLHYQVYKRPLILADSGFFYQGIKNYTYYYSLTGIKVTGTISFLGTTEKVTGEAWIDRQFGSFNPYTGEAYEWLSLRLNTGMDINVWNIFTNDNRLPDTSTYRLVGVYIDDSTARTLSDFELERTAFRTLPREGNVYASEFHLVVDSLGVDIRISTTNNRSEVRRPFYFYEGPVIVQGKVRGKQVKGEGFAELLHQYRSPVIILDYPENEWDLRKAIRWHLANPDDGRKEHYDLSIKTENDSLFTPIARGITETFYHLDTSASIPADSLIWLRILGYSIDTSLNDTLISKRAFPIITGTSHSLHPDYDVRLFPNPCKDILYIRHNKGSIPHELTVSVFNETGHLLRKQLLPHKMTLEMSGFANGKYFVLIKGEKGLQFHTVIKTD